MNKRLLSLALGIVLLSGCGTAGVQPQRDAEKGKSIENSVTVPPETEAKLPMPQDPGTEVQPGAGAGDSTVSPENSMPENLEPDEAGFLISNDVLYGYEGEETGIVVPAGVTEIADFAFRGKELQKVVLPEGLKRIGNWAFAGQSELREINLPDGLESIGEYALYFCNGIYDIRLPKSLKEIGFAAFEGCELPEIEIPSGVTCIAPFAFTGTQLYRLTLAEGLTEIGAYAFSGCFLKEVNLPSSLRGIGEGAFQFNMLNAVTIPDGVSEIGEYAFASNGELSKVRFSSGLKTLGNGAFSGCGITELVLPDSLACIGDSCFSNCANLTEVTLPTGLKSIGSEAFAFCSSLETVHFNGKLNHLGEDAFEGTALPQFEMEKFGTEGEEPSETQKNEDHIEEDAAPVAQIVPLNNAWLALREDGTVRATELEGWTEYLVQDPFSDCYILSENAREEIETWTDIVALAGSSSIVGGLKSDGTVVAVWLSPYDGQSDSVSTADDLKTDQNPSLREIETWTDVTTLVAAPDRQVLAGIRSDGTVLLSSTDNRQDLQHLRYWEHVKKLELKGPMTLRDDGTLLGIWSYYWSTVNRVPGHKIVDFASNGFLTAALLEDGSCRFFQDGTGSEVQVEGWENVKQVLATDAAVFGLREDGSIVASTTADFFDENDRAQVLPITGVERLEDWKTGDYRSTEWINAYLDDGSVVAISVNADDEIVTSPGPEGWTDLNWYGKYDSGPAIGLKTDGTVLVMNSDR